MPNERDFAPLRLFVVRYEPTEAELIDALDKCRGFLDEAEAEMDKLRALAREGRNHD